MNEYIEIVSPEFNIKASQDFVSPFTNENKYLYAIKNHSSSTVVKLKDKI